MFALLNVGVLLFGAGSGTPFAVGLPVVVSGAVALRRTRQRRRDAATIRRLRWVFEASFWMQILSWALVFPVMFVLSFYREIPDALFLFALLIMPISIIAALSAALALDGAVRDDESASAARPLEKPLPGYQEAKPVVFAGLYARLAFPDLTAAG